MKKIAITLCIALGFISFNNAQSINFGITAGYVNVSNRVDAGQGTFASEDVSGLWGYLIRHRCY